MRDDRGEGWWSKIVQNSVTSFMDDPITTYQISFKTNWLKIGVAETALQHPTQTAAFIIVITHVLIILNPLSHHLLTIA